MEATAKATYVRISPRKVQIVLDLNQKAACRQGHGYSAIHPKGRLCACDEGAQVRYRTMQRTTTIWMYHDLYVSECYVGAGPTLKRIQARAQGRAYRINKRTSHITITVKEMED